MTDPLFDDVQTLLDKEKGDERILKQILRACENNEVISNYERNYVKNLAEKYLGRLPENTDDQSTEEKQTISDVIVPTPLQQKIEIPTSMTPQIIQKKPKNPKMLIGAGMAVLAIIIVIGISQSGISIMESDSIIDSDSSSASLSIQTDLSSYQKGDIISISGKSNTSETINISIENQNDQLVWSEQLSVKKDGRFSTLAIAGGPGWDKSGTYTIKVENNMETKSKTFSFKV
ncbi:hypothetical protein [Nitrosarchaeum koreense]|uniref:Type I membrane protein n=1 Tax=Nitrosarchaeum koreense MY1 TaxID=1001994 RepID=F9CY29_9ARCH|nr:hypothetical protein [Nitrosarchaeum koreense]EGP94384.1 Type I membrane protein [Nitrosarchaeum koreense MY1]